MKIGLLREEKIPADRRVALTPKQCRRVKMLFPDLELIVQSSDVRCFTNEEYISEGIKVMHDISDCDILFGVKEVPKRLLIPNKTYLYFSHTIKKQPYNRGLLVKMLELRIKMVDYEVLRNKEGERLLGFGRYAGIVGAYNGFLTYGLRSERYTLKAAHQCSDREELEGELKNLTLDNEKTIITGNGRVGMGIMEIMKKSGIKQVSVDEFLNSTFKEAVFVHLNTMDYNERIDGLPSDKYDFYSNPQLYKSSFKKFTRTADIFIAGHYYASGSPYLFTRKDAKSHDFNLKVIADISCDIDGPVASTIRPSTISNPIYGYHPITEQEVYFKEEDSIAVMAVSNLPCELPKDSSEDFGNDIIEKVLPYLINGDDEEIISNATICTEGDLNPNFEYLRQYINGD